MVNPEVPGETTSVLKWESDVLCPCQGCERKVRKRLEKIHGVNSIGKIDMDNGQGKVTIQIWGTVDPHTVKKEFEKYKKIKNVDLILSEESPPPPPLDHQEMQLALLQTKPLLPQQPIVPQEPDGFSITALDESTIWKKTNDCDHPELKLRRYNKRFTCDGCKEDGFGPRYRCEEQNCAFELHQECRNPNPTKTIKLFHGSRKTTIEFCRNPPSDKWCCDACGKYIRGCFYSYRDVDSNLDMDLHPQCSSLKAQIQVQGTVFELREKNKLKKCLWCNKKKSRDEEQSGIRGWSYVSKCNNYHFHLCCVTEMLHEASKEGGFASDVDDTDEVISKALETIDFRKMQAKSKRDGDGRGSEFWKIARMFLKTIIGILLGDPTVLIASTLIELLK